MTTAFPKRIFSGVQPTGKLHLGNYLGAIKQWLSLQESTRSPTSTSTSASASTSISSTSPTSLLFSVVDLHAMTHKYDAKGLYNSTRQMAISLLACGLDPNLVTIFRQSAVREHSELAWILGCLTPIGTLSRMTQFKQKAGSLSTSNNLSSAAAASSGLGLLSYPVLQTADIVLYKATHVPVGEDQKQHIELARSIANSFNNFAENNIFPLPETLLLDGLGSSSARVMSLKDATKKMSKSDSIEDSRINLTDTIDDIVRKIKGAKTDSTLGFTFDIEKRPEKSNLLSIYASLSGEKIEVLTERYNMSQGSVFKNELSDLIIQHITPIGKEIQRLQTDLSYVDLVMTEGAKRASIIAAETMKEVRSHCGYM